MYSLKSHGYLLWTKDVKKWVRAKRAYNLKKSGDLCLKMNRAFSKLKLLLERIIYQINGIIVHPSFPLSKKGKITLLKIMPGHRSDPALIRTLYGFKMNVDKVGEGIESHLRLFGTYEKGTLQIMRFILKEGSAFLDGGANIGIMSLYASKLVGPQGKVFAFEPYPETYNKLLENLGLNTHSDNVQTFQLALSNEAGPGVIYEHITPSAGSNSMLASFADHDSTEITQTNLDEIVGPDENVDLIKLDIEGFEYKAVLGGLKVIERHRPALIIEVNQEISPHEEIDALMTLLQTLGYELFKPTFHMHKESKIERVHSRSQLSEFNNLYAFMDKHLASMPRQLFKS